MYIIQTFLFKEKVKFLDTTLKKNSVFERKRSLNFPFYIEMFWFSAKSSLKSISSISDFRPKKIEVLWVFDTLNTPGEISSLFAMNLILNNIFDSVFEIFMKSWKSILTLFEIRNWLVGGLKYQFAKVFSNIHLISMWKPSLEQLFVANKSQKHSRKLFSIFLSLNSKSQSAIFPLALKTKINFI